MLLSLLPHRQRQELCRVCRTLGHNRLGAEGAAALAPALQQLTGLSQLRLHFNYLGPFGMAALAPALEQLTGLQMLCVGVGRLLTH